MPAAMGRWPQRLWENRHALPHGLRCLFPQLGIRVAAIGCGTTAKGYRRRTAATPCSARRIASTWSRKPPTFTLPLSRRAILFPASDRSGGAISAGRELVRLELVRALDASRPEGCHGGHL